MNITTSSERENINRPCGHKKFALSKNQVVKTLAQNKYSKKKKKKDKRKYTQYQIAVERNYE